MAGATGLGEDLLALGRRAPSPPRPRRRSGRAPLLGRLVAAATLGWRPRSLFFIAASYFLGWVLSSITSAGMPRPKLDQPSPRTPVRRWGARRRTSAPTRGWPEGGSAQRASSTSKAAALCHAPGGDPPRRPWTVLLFSLVSVMYRGLGYGRTPLASIPLLLGPCSFEADIQGGGAAVPLADRRGAQGGAPNLGGRGVVRCGPGSLPAPAAGPGLRPHRTGRQSMAVALGETHLTAPCRRSCTVSSIPAQIQWGASSTSLGRRRRRDSPTTWAPCSAFGSLLNFVHAPESAPPVKPRQFDGIECTLGYRVSVQESALEQYRRHVGFAADVLARAQDRASRSVTFWTQRS